MLSMNICIISFYFIQCLLVPPQLLSSKHSPVIATVGSTVHLKCPVISDPDNLFIEWMKNDRFIVETKRFRQTFNGALKIKSAAVDDSGVYVCKGKKLSEKNMITYGNQFTLINY